jgi:hypothetical protein
MKGVAFIVEQSACPGRGKFVSLSSVFAMSSHTASKS